MLGPARWRDFALERFPYAQADVSRRTSICLSALTFVLAVAINSEGSLASRASAQHPDADLRILQISSRLYNGFGFGHGLQHTGLLGDTGIRTDFLWGDPGDEHVRFGPQIDIRSACDLPIFLACLGNQTIEFSAGPSLLIPFRRGYPLQLSPTLQVRVVELVVGGFVGLCDLADLVPDLGELGADRVIGEAFDLLLESIGGIDQGLESSDLAVVRVDETG